ncbi:MAG: dockerin type I domain-containing protein, partial [Anaerolineales bacterium]|nr:dockerin type I domain-containing protein [Anaerolineales bacterium]
PTDDNPGPPADNAAQDFTIEWWRQALPGENSADAITCGENKDWLTGNMIFDRDRFGEDRNYGVSMAGEILVFGVSGDGTGDLTICGTSNLGDGTWHHLALQRSSSDGWMQLFVDGVMEVEGDGPDGDISYPDDYTPPDLCGTSGDLPCINSDHYLVIGAEKHRSSSEHPSFSGWIDEIRFSNVLRYNADFTVPALRFSADENTAALYQFNEGFGNLIHDLSGFAGGPSNGERIYGGVINGPEWTDDTRWYVAPPTPAPTPTPETPTPLPETPTPAPDTPTPTDTTSPTPVAPSPTNTPSPIPIIPTNTGTPIPELPSPTATQTPISSLTPTPEVMDINADGRVDIVDIQLCINVFLGVELDPDISAQADVNGDGNVNVMDVQMMVNSILMG